MRVHGRRGGFVCIATLLVAGALALPAGSSAATTRFAEPNGNGPASTCPESDPCSFKVAVSDPSVANGDNVIVLPGSYEDQTGFFSVSRAITIESRPGDPVPVVPVSNSGFGLFVINSAVVVRRLHLTSNTGTALWLNSGGTVERLFLETTGINQFACVIGGDPLVRDSVCHATNADAEGGGVTFSVGGDVTQSATLRNVTAVGEGAAGEGIRVSAGAVGSGANGARLTLDAKNVIANGEARDLAAITDNSPMATATINVAYSNFNSQTVTGSGAQVVDGGGNQTPPPVFADANFHQAANSPTLDAGSSSASLLLDIDGDSRSLDGNCDGAAAPDIGADEFKANCPLPPPAAARDTTPPQTTITKSPPNKGDDNSIKFKFKSSEPGSTFKCKIDGKPYKRCRSPRKYVVGEDLHKFKVIAVDAAGNADPTPDKDKFKVTD